MDKIKDGGVFMPGFGDKKANQSKTLKDIKVGDNLRGVVFTFDLFFDVADFLREYPGINLGGAVFNDDTGSYGGLRISSFGYSNISAWSVHQFGFGKPVSAPPAISGVGIWADTVGWKGASFTMPDDMDYIVTSASIQDTALARAIKW